MTAEPTGGPVPPIVQFERISKRFPGVVALREVSFAVARGSCHALCGENGAGKSTLGKILAGLYVPDEGRILLDGAAVRFASPRDARAAGIAIVHQEPTFCRNLSVAENLCLAALPRRGPIVDRAALRARAQAILDSVGLVLDVDRPVEHLTPGQHQLLQIAAAAGSGPRVILFDEPTSSLGDHEAAQLFALMARVRAQGATCLYVSHRLREIFHLCDAVTVLRDGTHVATRPAGRAGRARARPDDDRPQPRGRDPRAPRGRRRGPSASRWSGSRARAASKASAFPCARARWSAWPVSWAPAAPRSRRRCSVSIRRPRASSPSTAPRCTVRDPSTALRLGLGLVPEDRQRQGLVLMLGGRTNTTLPDPRAPGPPDLGAARRGGGAGRGPVRAAARAHPAHRLPGGGPLRRQPAEDRPRALAGRALPDPHPRRAHPRRGRRGQGGDPRPHRPPGRGRQRPSS